jgi:hypothetical protein
MLPDHTDAEPLPTDFAPPNGRRLGMRLVNAYCFLAADGISLEPEMVASRWPAYFGLDPMAANVLFGRAYQNSFREQFRAEIDVIGAKTVRGLDLTLLQFPKDGRRSGEITAINNARQLADRAGLPYEQFIGFCMNFASRRGCSHIARPNQLVPSLKNKFRSAWDRELEKFSRDFEDTMPSEYREAQNRGRDGRPGCFGVPGAHNADQELCQRCPRAGTCILLAKGIVSVVERKSPGNIAMRSHTDKRTTKLAERKRVKAARRKVLYHIEKAAHGAPA